MIRNYFSLVWLDLFDLLCFVLFSLFFKIRNKFRLGLL
jgi:hypothetical protein